jgi:hypothetical protein
VTRLDLKTQNLSTIPIILVLRGSGASFTMFTYEKSLVFAKSDLKITGLEIIFV